MSVKPSINHWTFPAEWPLERCFRVAKDAGFQGFEVNLGESGALAPSSTEQEVREVAEQARRIGIELSSLSTNLFGRNPLTSPDPGVREKGAALGRKMLQVAGWLGVDAVLVVPGVVTAEVPYDDAYHRAQESLKTLVKDAEAAQICMCVENVWNKFLLSPLEMCRFVDEIGSPWVQCYFDVGNVLVFSFPQHWIRILGTRIKRIHVKDFKTQIGNIRGFTNLLEGDVDWLEVVSALREVGYDSFVTAELSGFRLYPERLIEETARTLDVILAS